MALYEIINIIGITAYSLVAIFFLWLMQVPNSGERAKYWFVAVLFLLLGRVDLYLFPAFLNPAQVQTVYAISLTLEKIFLIIGLTLFIDSNQLKTPTKRLLTFGYAVLIGLLLIFYVNNAQILSQAYFSTTQAIFLLIVAHLLRQETFNQEINNKSMLIAVLVIYALHWLTFPIALQYPTWLSLGYFVGNVLNLTVYLSFAYMVINRFQKRMILAEQSALNLVKEANQASKAKSDFLANMSHEIRTPMNGVISMLELLHHDKLTSEQHQRVAIALSSGKNLLQVINDILDFSKIEAGKLAFDHIDFNLIEMIEDVVDIVKSSAHHKGLELMIDVADVKLVMVNSDPLRIKQVLLNLLSNAIKFTEQGEVLVKASVVEKSSGLHFTCAIIDSGIGIDDDKREQIFQSFQQEDTSTTRNYGGTGLGLSISKHICVLLGGKISVSSQKGVGSCFTIAIPLSPCSAASKQPQPPSFNNINTLVVDRSNTQLTVITKLLNNWGVATETAITGEQALKLCQANAFDFIILGDYIEMAGVATLDEKIPQLEHTRPVKVIQLLSIVEDNESHAQINPNVDAVIAKPVFATTLFATINNLYQANVSSPPEREYSTTAPELEIPNWPVGTRILLIEDNRINQVVATQLLAHFNLSCDIANHGAEALAMLYASLKTNAPYQLILMDCQMPVMDGYVTTENIRKGKGGEEYKQTPIIAMTAHAMAGDKEKCLAIGMNDYLSKPLDKNKTLEKLKTWLIPE